MIYCKECGKVNPDGTKFCGGCGTPLEQPEVVVQAQPVVEPTTQNVKGEAKCWRIFAKVGFILGIITIAIAPTFIFSVFALVTGQPGLVFSILGMRTKDVSAHKKAKVGMILSIIGLVIGFIMYVILVAIGIASEVGGVYFDY